MAKPFDPRVISSARQRRESETNQEAPASIASHYYPGLAPGTIVNGIRCENLERLSFGDESFDLHLTQDVFEHLFDPAAACRDLPLREFPKQVERTLSG
jgi:Methyltransferase domain